MIQPHFCRNQGCRQPTRLEQADIDQRAVAVPESMRRVWLAELATAPVLRKVRQKRSGPLIPGYARADLGFADPQAQ